MQFTRLRTSPKGCPLVGVLKWVFWTGCFLGVFWVDNRLLRISMTRLKCVKSTHVSEQRTRAAYLKHVWCSNCTKRTRPRCFWSDDISRGAFMEFVGFLGTEGANDIYFVYVLCILRITWTRLYLRWSESNMVLFGYVSRLNSRGMSDLTVGVSNYIRIRWIVLMGVSLNTSVGGVTDDIRNDFSELFLD